MRESLSPGRIGRPGIIQTLIVGLATTAAAGQEPTPVPRGPVTVPMTQPRAVQALDNAVQVVRLTVPEGVQLNIVAPQPDPVPGGDGRGNMTVGLRVGTSYRFRISNLLGRPDAELYPIVEMVGHLHRPANIDPGQFPIRIVLRQEDIEDALLRGRLVTHVVYLEDPELAVPVAMPKDDIPTVNLDPSENPLKVAGALGRVMAIVRIGGRTPSAEELTFPPGMAPIAATACPFAATGNVPCGVPLGPTCGTPPPRDRLWIPKDEYLCDGGDHAKPASFGGNGGLRGIDPRDAVIRFSRPKLEQLLPELERLRERFEKGEISAETYNIEARRLNRSVEGDIRPRVLPTNVVCIYAPRFASVRVVVGPNEALTVQTLKGAELLQRQEQSLAKQELIRLTQNQSPVINRHRARPSAAITKVGLITHAEVRVLSGYDVPTRLMENDLLQVVDVSKGRQGPGKIRTAEAAVAIKTGEGVVVRARAEGLGQKIMSWKPQETAGVEVPPNQPGLAVLKRVSTSVAEPGEKVQFSIQYRNMGNVPLSDVSILDSLLARFEYVPGSATGPKGAIFTANENRAGSVELRWDLPGIIEPGAEGYVSFEVIIR